MDTQECRDRLSDGLLKIRFLSDSFTALSETHPEINTVLGASRILDEIDESLNLVYEEMERSA
jgi:hypothetical protein